MSAVKKLFCLLLILTFQINGQFNIEWEKTWNSPYNNWDRATHINIDNEGNIVVAGWSFKSDLNSSGDIAVVKYSQDGNELWNQRYDIGSYDKVIGLYFDADNNIIIGATGADSSNYYPSFMIIKYDPEGNLISDKKAWLYIGGNNVTGKADKLHRDNYNNLIIGGLVANNIWKIKFDLNGNVSETFTDFIVDTLVFNSYQSYLNKSSSELTLPMQSWSNQGKYFFGALQLNNDASPRWYKRLLSNSYGQEPFCNGIIKNSSGNTYIGIKNILWDSDLQKHIDDQHIMKLDNDGLILWDRVLDAVPDKRSEINNLALDYNGNLLVTGTTKGRYFTSKYSSAGELNLFIQNEDTTLFSGLYVLPEENGRFYTLFWDLTGSVYLAKYDVYGNETHRIKLQGLNEYYPLEIFGVMYDQHKNILLTGNKRVGWNYDFYTIKLNDLATGIKDDLAVNDFRLEQNYPNPFNPATVISYQLSAFSKVSLKVYDILGNEVTTLVNEEKSPGKYEVQWNAAGFASGVYFYRLQAGEFISVKKLILIK